MYWETSGALHFSDSCAEERRRKIISMEAGIHSKGIEVLSSRKALSDTRGEGLLSLSSQTKRPCGQEVLRVLEFQFSQCLAVLCSHPHPTWVCKVRKQFTGNTVGDRGFPALLGVTGTNHQVKRDGLKPSTWWSFHLSIPVSVFTRMVISVPIQEDG